MIFYQIVFIHAYYCCMIRCWKRMPDWGLSMIIDVCNIFRPIERPTKIWLRWLFLPVPLSSTQDLFTIFSQNMNIFIFLLSFIITIKLFSSHLFIWNFKCQIFVWNFFSRDYIAILILSRICLHSSVVWLTNDSSRNRRKIDEEKKKVWKSLNSYVHLRNSRCHKKQLQHCCFVCYHETNLVWCASQTQRFQCSPFVSFFSSNFTRMKSKMQFI